MLYYYGNEFKEDLKSSIRAYQKSATIRKYETRIDEVKVSTTDNQIEQCLAFATAEQATKQMDSIRSLARNYYTHVDTFYTETEETLDNIKKSAADINEMLNEITGFMQRMSEELTHIGDFKGQTVNPARVKELSIDKTRFSQLNTDAWNNLFEAQIKNDKISNVALTAYFKRTCPKMDQGEELSKPEMEYLDPMVAQFVKNVEKTHIIDDTILHSVFKYYVDHRNDANLVSEQRLDNCNFLYEHIDHNAGKTMDAFFLPAFLRMDDNITLQTKRIKYTVYTAAPEYRDVILHYLPHVRLNIIEKDGVANYNPNTRDIFGRRTINLALEDTSSDDSSFCHEFGQALDDYLAKDNDTVNNISDSYKDTLLSECREHLKGTIESYNAKADDAHKLSDPEQTLLLDYFFSKDNPNVSLDNDPNYFRTLLPSTWDDKMKDAYESVRNYYGYEEYVYLEDKDYVYKTNERSQEFSRFGCKIILCDMFGGATNNKIGGMGSHTLSQKNLKSDGKTPITSDSVKSADALYDCLRGYNYFYYLDNDGNEVLRNICPTEFFAENFDFKMNNKDMTEVYQILGKTSKQFDDIYAKIAADVLGENTNK